MQLYRWLATSASALMMSPFPRISLYMLTRSHRCPLRAVHYWKPDTLPLNPRHGRPTDLQGINCHWLKGAMCIYAWKIPTQLTDTRCLYQSLQIWYDTTRWQGHTPQWHWMTSILSSKPWRRHQLGGRPEPTSEPLAKVNLQKAAGPDNIPGHGLKKCWKTCSPILVTTPPPSPRDIPDIPRHTHTHYGIPAFNTIFPQEMVWTCGTHYIQHWHR